MKRGALLNTHLSQLVASIGHLDEITIADAGLPAPSGVAVIDLAVSPGIPSFFDVVSALGLEAVIEDVVEAEEASDDLKARFAGNFWRGKPLRIGLLADQRYSHMPRLRNAQRIKKR